MVGTSPRKPRGRSDIVEGNTAGGNVRLYIPQAPAFSPDALLFALF